MLSYREAVEHRGYVMLRKFRLILSWADGFCSLFGSPNLGWVGLLFVTECIGWEPPGGRRLGWPLYISDSHIEMGICASQFFVLVFLFGFLACVY